MAILVSKETKAIVQGITGRQGVFHTKLMLEYGTKIVAGSTPGRGGETIEGIRVYDSVREALEEHDANASIIFVPAPSAKDAALEAMDAKLNPIVIITEGIPVHDELIIARVASEKRIKIIGPNTPGVITPSECKLGIMPGHVFKRGNVGIIQSTCLGIGGDPVTGLDFTEVMEMFKDDDETKSVAIIGEIGGDAEERTAKYISEMKFKKQVVAFIAGKTAPSGKRMGHAGAIITGSSGTAETKIKALRDAGVGVASKPSEVAELIRE